MKIILLFFILLGIVYNLQAQKNIEIAVAPTKMNVFYMFVDNPVKVVVTNIDPKYIWIKTNNGKVVGSNSEFIVRPAHIGKAIISVYAERKELAKKEFRVKYYPPPIPKIAGKREGYVSKARLLAGLYIEANLENSDIDISYSVDSFAVKIYKEKKRIYLEKIKGRKLTESLKNKIMSLAGGEKIIFEQIYITYPNKEIIRLDDMVFKIKEQDTN